MFALKRQHGFESPVARERGSHIIASHSDDHGVNELYPSQQIQTERSTLCELTNIRRCGNTQMHHSHSLLTPMYSKSLSLRVFLYGLSLVFVFEFPKYNFCVMYRGTLLKLIPQVPSLGFRYLMAQDVLCFDEGGLLRFSLHFVDDIVDWGDEISVYVHFGDELVEYLRW